MQWITFYVIHLFFQDGAHTAVEVILFGILYLCVHYFWFPIHCLCILRIYYSVQQSHAHCILLSFELLLEASFSLKCYKSLPVDNC